MIDESQSKQSPVVGQGDAETVSFTKYDRQSLSYASTFDDPIKSRIISLIELFTGRISILRMIRKFEENGAPKGQGFWRAALDTMGIDLTTPQDQLDHIPKSGPVIVVANHDSAPGRGVTVLRLGVEPVYRAAIFAGSMMLSSQIAATVSSVM